MKNSLEKAVDLEESLINICRLKKLQPQNVQGVFVGKLTSVKDTGHILVDYEDNPFGSLPARSTINITFEDKNRDVLLTFERNDPRLPIITGFVQKKPVTPSHSNEIAVDRKRIKDIILDGEKIVLNAEREIILRCGDGSITLRADGKIVIKGNHLLNRSRNTNKIKGATVQIN